MAHGNEVKKPRVGWIATKPGAFFELHVVAKELPIRKVTLIYMKSYGRKWLDAKLKVELSVLGNASVATAYYLDGIHNDTTSVNYRTQMEGIHAKVGETVVARFTLVGGYTFKISGMLFCAS